MSGEPGIKPSIHHDLRFGLFTANQQPVGARMDEALADQIEIVHRVRDAGWDSVWTGHHYLTEESIQMAPVVYLARMAAEAGEMTLGLGVMLLALVNPVEAAEVVASLDIAANGRFVFGAGLGYRAIEHAAFGITAKEAVGRFENNLRIVKSLLSGDVVTEDLPWCRLDQVQLRLRSIQNPRPAIWIGGDADPAVRRAARLGDAWLVNPHASIHTVRRQLEFYKRERSGVDAGASRLPVMREIFCADSSVAARETAERFLGEKYRVYEVWGQGGALPPDDSLDLPFSDLSRGRFIVGDPDDCIEGLMEWAELGVTDFILRTHWAGMPHGLAKRSLDLLCDEVVPAFRSG
ncbi:MAG: LLM class flavin-dependent oxidoreductase [Ferrimicrobium sp.]